ncbi:unnamed protein product [Ectocarpus sp. 12 AP-2014]
MYPRAFISLVVHNEPRSAKRDSSFPSVRRGKNRLDLPGAQVSINDRLNFPSLSTSTRSPEHRLTICWPVRNKKIEFSPPHWFGRTPTAGGHGSPAFVAKSHRRYSPPIPAEL